MPDRLAPNSRPRGPSPGDAGAGTRGLWWLAPVVLGLGGLAFGAWLPQPTTTVVCLAVSVTGLIGLSAWAVSLCRRARSGAGRGTCDLEALVRHSPGPTYAFEINTRTILHCNRALADLLGYPIEELEGRRGLDLVPEWVQSRAEVGLDRLWVKGDVDEREVPWVRKDGRVVWVDISAKVVETDPEPVALIALHNITERRAMEEQLARRSEELRRANEELSANLTRLAESEARHRALFTQATDAVLLADVEDLRVRDANPEALALIGLNRAELVGKHLSLLNAGSASSLENVAQETIRRTGLLLSEVPLRGHGGRTIYVDLSASLVTYHDESVLQFVLHDVSDRRRLREALERTNAELERQRTELQKVNAQLARVNAVKSHFLANMSHEIRTPLNAINGFAELLADRSFGKLNEQQEGFVERIIDAGQHLLQLINDVIDLSRVEAGTIKLDLQPVSVRRAAEQAVKIIVGTARQRGVSVVLDAEEEDRLVLADDRRIKQVLFNLMTNAIRYAPEGTPVDVRVRSEDGWVKVSVTDRGIGIPPEDHTRIFEEFVQLGRPEDQPGHSGLGLPLSKNLIELHHGKIGVDSAPGKGSTFWFTLPVLDPALLTDDMDEMTPEELWAKVGIGGGGG